MERPLSRIAVIGLDGGPLSAEVQGLLQEATLVIGSGRHLETLGIDPERAAALEGDLSEALGQIEQTRGPVTVLASGDPGFFGIARLLAERFGAENLRVFPGVSSVALAFARAGLSWDDAVTVSAHGRDPRRALPPGRAPPTEARLPTPAAGPPEHPQELEPRERTF